MSVRLRLTLSYAGFLLIAGAAMVALLFYLLRFVPDETITSAGMFVPNRSDLIETLAPRVWQVLAALAVVGLAGGWLLAGYILRPLRRINAVAREVAAGTLDQRVELDGPNDEFRLLADTFDSMLERLQQSFDEQRRFSANASHELRTPHAITRSILDVAMADPAGQDVGELVRRLDETNRRGIEIVEALLALAALDAHDQLEREPVDIAEVAMAVVDELRPLAESTGVELHAKLGEGSLDGRAVLVRQLISNLVLNGIRHNVVNGRVDLTTTTTDEGVVEVVVENTGPTLSDELLATMTEPFVRGPGRVAAIGEFAGHTRGAGLGLSIVARIALVHGAELTLEARRLGGLVARVRFSAPDISSAS
ncbi:sensor histidine kinase [Marisediminicola sp. LYQ134]|uniref:sensor histidine kinase n=1 Tax=Marisediminicola sp. LYQ134 TaxID=3391061 RepID=UPI0039833287